MEIIVSLLANKETSFSGRFFALENAWCEPKPVQDPIPIVIGGKGRVRTLRTAARFADQWDMTLPETPSDWQELDEVLRSHCERVGRDQAEITRSVHLGTDGEPAELLERAQDFFDAGVDVVVWSWRGELDPAGLEALNAAIEAA